MQLELGFVDALLFQVALILAVNVTTLTGFSIPLSPSAFSISS
jgi:hypothetical protein